MILAACIAASTLLQGGATPPGAPAATPAPAGTRESFILIQTHVYQLRDSQLLAEGAVIESLPGDAAPSLVIAKDIAVMDDGKRLGLDDLASHVVTAPRLFISADSAAQVDIGRQVASEHMEPAGNGTYRLVHDDPYQEGLHMEVTAAPTVDGAVGIKRLVVRMDQCVGRKEVPGTSLPVGEPILRTTTVERSFILPKGQTAMLTMPALDGSGETVLVAVQAWMVDDPNAAAASGTARPAPPTR